MERNISVQQYREFREMAEDHKINRYFAVAVLHLLEQAVRRIFSYDTMQLDRLGEEKTAIFVVVRLLIQHSIS